MRSETSGADVTSAIGRAGRKGGAEGGLTGTAATATWPARRQSWQDMAARLATPGGQAVYGKRAATIEPALLVPYGPAPGIPLLRDATAWLARMSRIS